MSKFVSIETSEGKNIWINTDAITRLEMAEGDEGGTVVYMSDGRDPVNTPYDILDFFMLFLDLKRKDDY